MSGNPSEGRTAADRTVADRMAAAPPAGRPDSADHPAGLAWLARMRVMGRYLTRDRAAIVAALLAPLAAAAVLLPLRGSWSNTNVALLLVVVVVAVAVLGNRVAGALAAVGAAIWFDFFFTLPYEQLTIRASPDVTTFVLLLVVGVAVSQLAARARRLKVIAITDAGYLARIHEAATLAKSARSAPAVVDHIRDQLVNVLDLQECRFEYGSLLGRPPRLEPDGSVMTRYGDWDVAQWGLPEGETELRVLVSGQYIGRFMLRPRPDSRPSLQARLVAVTLAGLAGRALGAWAPPAA
jgi:K+-sensing histidine kinase KdpD